MGAIEMTFQHDNEGVTIAVGERTTILRIAVARLESSSRCMASIAPTATEAVALVLQRVSAAMADAGRKPLSIAEQATVLALLAA
jgi:hypothetical protein